MLSPRAPAAPERDRRKKRAGRPLRERPLTARDPRLAPGARPGLEWGPVPSAGLGAFERGQAAFAAADVSGWGGAASSVRWPADVSFSAWSQWRSACPSGHPSACQMA